MTSPAYPVRRLSLLAPACLAACVAAPALAEETDYVLTDAFDRPVLSVSYTSLESILTVPEAPADAPSFVEIGGEGDAPGTPAEGGSDGNDTYHLGDSDQPLLADSGGYDTITSTVTRDLEDFPDMEHLVLLGSADIDGYGNVKANRIVGNDGDNVIAGRGGADTLMGGRGDDTYVLEAATNDTIEDEDGDDTITSTITRDLADFPGIENLELTFSAHVDGFGDEGPNRLVGNAGSNRLSGRGGDDTLDGGKGADTLEGGPGQDTFVLSDPAHSPPAAGHRDRIADFEPGVDRIDLSALGPLSFAGASAFSGVAGQVRVSARDGYHMLEVDLDGDGAADAAIEIVSPDAPSEADLLLAE
jgi:RTX toxins and related Ca2+-binding proteins